jgi:predicted nucleotidyltransferase
MKEEEKDETRIAHNNGWSMPNTNAGTIDLCACSCQTNSTEND